MSQDGPGREPLWDDFDAPLENQERAAATMA